MLCCFHLCDWFRSELGRFILMFFCTRYKIINYLDDFRKLIVMRKVITIVDSYCFNLKFHIDHNK